MKSKNIIRTSRACGFVTVTFQLVAAAGAFAATWTGTTSTDWNTATNWDGNAVPSGVDANIQTIPANIATITSTPPDVAGVFVGTSGTGRVDHRAGSLNASGGFNAGVVGNGGGNAGTYNLANTATAAAGISGFAPGDGSLAMTGYMVTGWNAGTGITNINTSGTVSVGNDFYIGLDAGNGRMNLEGGTLNVSGQSRIGQGGSAVGRLDMAGGAYTSSGEMFVGWNGGGGTINQSAGNITVNSWLNVGRDTGTGALNMSGGTMTVQQEARIGFNDNGSSGSSGTIALSNGAFLSAGFAVIGGKNVANAGGTANGTGTMTGELTIFNTSGNFVVGNGNGSTGTFSASGGTLAVNGELWSGNGAGANGTLNVSAGTVTASSWLAVGRDGSTGVLNISGSALVSKANINGHVEITNNGGSGTLNLNGGTLLADRVQFSGGPSATAVFNFNGGTLTAFGNDATFFENVNGSAGVINVKAAGAVIDSNGNDIATTLALRADPVSTGGGLTKNGAGALTLGGANTYTGPTAVQDGTLLVNGSTVAASAATVAATATLGGSGTVAGTVTAAGTIAPGGDGIGTLTTGNAVLTGTLASQVSAADTDRLAAGTLKITGATLTVTELAPGSAASYIIATYTGTLTGTFATTNLPPGYSVSYATAGQILLLKSAGTGYASWAATHGIPGEPFGSDFDKDGLSNGLEYALGANPTGSTAAAPLVKSGADYTLSYTKGTEAAADPNLAYSFETSTNLVTWTAATPTVNNATTVSYTLPGGTSPRFVRLKIVQIP